MRRVLITAAIVLGAPWALLFATLLLLSLGGDVVTLAKMVVREGDKKERHTLPAYDDVQLAKQIFSDAKKTVELYAPFVGWQRDALTSRTVNIDANGLRQHRLGRNNLPNSTTVGFFGGSLVWGTGAEDDGTVPALFDQMTDRFEVINYGQGGWTSRQSLALLINLIREDRMPDVVVFYGGAANTVDVACNLSYGLGLSNHRRVPPFDRLVADAANLSYLYRNFWAPFGDTLRRVLGRDKPEPERVCHEDPRRVAVIAEALMRDWEMAKLLTEQHGGRFFTFLPPVAGVGAPRLDHLTLDQERLAQFAPVYREIRRLMAARAASWGWDLTDAFDGDAYIYVDYAHVTSTGNTLIAQRMRQVIGSAVPTR
jgi:hypothetical protein